MSRAPRVLIIDDDEFLRKGLEHALRKLGVESVLTDDPGEFLRRAASGSFDLYMIDLYLADGKSGLELVESLRGSLGPRPRIMMLSAAGDTQTIVTALRRGANDFVLKPLDRAHLAAKLSRYLRTEPLQGALEIPIGGVESRAPGRLGFQAEVVEVDERGALVKGPHLIPKGTIAWLDGKLIRDIAGSDGPRGPQPVKVISSWAEAGEGAGYGAFAEFDRTRSDIRWFRALRRWLLAERAR